MTHEDARGLADSLAEWEDTVMIKLGAKGYADSAITVEIALLHARRAEKFGIDLLREVSTTQPVEKGRNGV